MTMFTKCQFCCDGFIAVTLLVKIIKSEARTYKINKFQNKITMPYLTNYYYLL